MYDKFRIVKLYYDGARTMRAPIYESIAEIN